MILNWYKKLAAYPRLRILLIVVGLIVAFVIVMNLFSTRQVQKTVIPQSKISASKVTPTRAHPVAAGEYNQLAQENQNLQRQAAENEGETYFDSNLLQGGQAVADQKQKPAAAKTPEPAKPKAAAPAPAPKVVTPEEFYSEQHNQQPQPVDQTNQDDSARQQQIQNAISQASQAMQSQLSAMSQAWSLPQQATVGGDGGGAGTATPSGAVTTTHVQIKAGTILFAVLDTELNSDQDKTPVLATIVTGRYRGTKLLGTFERQDEKLVLHFTTMSIPDRDSSIGVNAYAIDAKTAQNALASGVDHHYLLRYGSIFAAGFLQGFGNAYSQVNNYGDGAGLINVYPSVAPTTKSAIYQGFGQVGTTLSSVMGNVFNRPPTVTLKQGTGMGILFMADESF
ncbi:MAG: hypothetical protein EBX40_03520 [Gammaproteobacteria bacterium]|nr:hypothetical protein [Gammaproteobacteria bacterium]